MMTGMVKDQHLEKQMEKHIGCMAGFFQIFDRHQALSTKRLLTPKRLPPPPPPQRDAAPPPLPSSASQPSTPPQEPQPKPSPLRDIRSPAPEPGTPAPEVSCKSPLPFPIFEFKEGTRSPWKFSKEAPRLSLDSRATTDAKGRMYPREIRTTANAADSGDENDKQRRSPSVIARLMGLDNLPRPEPEATTKDAELRRSASESRVNRDLYRFVDGNSFQSNQMPQVQANVINGGHADGKTDGIVVRNAFRDAKNGRPESVKAPHRGVGMVQRKIFYDSTDFFPEPKRTASIYEEIEKRLKMRGIDEPSKDLETLKHILDALQLKGLLHSKRPLHHQRNFVYDNTFNDSPVVQMKPSRQPPNRFGRNGSDSPPTTFRSRPGATGRRNLNVAGESFPSASPRNQIGGRTTSVSPNRNDAGVKSPIRRRPLTVEVHKKSSDVAEQRRVSPVQSPKVGPRRIGVDQRSPRVRKPTVEMYTTAEDESSTMSESSVSTPSQTDTERSKGEEFKDGKNLLERCDKLLHSIAEMTTATTGDLQPQPSPVSVLDSSLYREESSPSPITMKRSIEFKDIETAESDDDVWSIAISTAEYSSKSEDDSQELIYISDILRATSCLPEDADIFLLLEKQYYLKGKNTHSRVSTLDRKLIFDTITELLSRKQHYNQQWRTSSSPEKPPLQQIWTEFKKMKERDTSEDLFESICGVLRKDLAGDGITGWGESPVEMSESVLDIERLIFKDLVSDAIRELAAAVSDCNNNSQLPRRRLVF